MKTCEQWLRRFLRFYGMRHPREMGSTEWNAFLSHLAVNEQVSASTQNQALAALLFLYRNLLERELELDGVVRARTRHGLPVALREAEAQAVRRQLEGRSKGLRTCVRQPVWLTMDSPRERAAVQ